MNTICQGTKVTLRPITKEDTNNIVRWRNNPNVLKNFIDQQLITPEGHIDWFENRVLTGNVSQFIILNNQTGKGIGSVFIRDIDFYHLHGEFGIFIGEDDERRKGFGSESCSLICSFAFEHLKLERIFLRVLSQNFSAIHSYERVGFITEGVLRKHVFVNKAFNDVVIMGLLKEEFYNGKH